MKVRITNIQRFSLHDGEGIRTTIFLKGCNLRCPWCANPENLAFEFTKYKKEETNEQGIFGQDIEALDLFEEIIKDKPYYEISNGGVTFSGGEPLLFIKALEPLLKKLKEENINITIETALQVPTELVEIASQYSDQFIIDIKILDAKKCKEILKGDIELYYKNLEMLAFKHQISIFRIPLAKEYTLEKNNLEQIKILLQTYAHKKVEIFKIHNLSESKYRAMGKEMPTFQNIEDEEVKKVYQTIKELGSEVEILKI